MTRRPARLLAVVALAISLGLASAASPLASSSPDGLERVARDQGFAGRATAHAVQDGAPIRDYGFSGVSDARVATGLAGFTGTLIAFASGYGAAAALRRRRTPA